MLPPMKIRKTPRKKPRKRVVPQLLLLPPPLLMLPLCCDLLVPPSMLVPDPEDRRCRVVEGTMAQGRDAAPPVGGGVHTKSNG